MNYIKYEDKVIEYTINKGKRKHIYISIQDGNVIVKAPKSVSNKYLEDVVEKRRDWIYEKVDVCRNSIKKPKEYVDGEVFKVLGEDCRLNIFYEDIKKARLVKDEFGINVYIPLQYKLLGNSEEEKKKIEKLVDNFYREIAQMEMELAMKKFIGIVGLCPNEYRIRNLKSSWGNCSSSRNISISKNLAMYGRECMEYVCVHELCHLRFMNHSRDFWNMVEGYMPGYKDVEMELKRK